MLNQPYEVTKEMMKGVKGLSEDFKPKVPSFIIKLKECDTRGRHYHPAFYCGGSHRGGYWHSDRGENYFHDEIEAYWEISPVEASLNNYKMIGCSSFVPCWYYDTCKSDTKDNCRCCWCDGRYRFGGKLVWNSKTKGYDLVNP
jgi:hypothetical protein